MSFAPLIPVWLLVLVVAAAGLAALRAYRRPQLPALFRALSLTLIALLLANPVRIEEAAKQRQPPLALVLDQSASMAALSERQDRLTRAAAALVQVEDAIGSRYRCVRHGLTTVLSSGFTDEAAGDTDFGALETLAAGDETPVAVVVASDGVDRGLVAPDDALAAAGVPVFVLAVGDQQAAANAAISLQAPSPTAFPGQDLILDLRIVASGAAVGKQTDVVVRDESGAEVLRKTVNLGAEQSLPVRYRLGADPGEQLWTAELAPVPGETTTADNRSSCSVQVVDRALRLVVVEGQPYWDTSFAVRAWRRDSQLAVQAVYRVGERRYRSGNADQRQEFDDLLADEGLEEIDLIVLGQQVDKVLSAKQQEALVAFVDDGGGVLFLGRHGGIDGALDRIDPLLRRRGSRDNITPTLTEAGQLAALLPATISLRPVAAGMISGLRPRTEILLGDEQMPLVVRRRYGGGKVAAVNAEGIWRWSMGKGADREVAARFWRQLVKGLVRRARPQLAADRPRYRQGQEAVVGVRGTDPVQVTDPAGATQDLAVASHQARLALDQPGVWELRQGQARLRLLVDADVREITAIERDDARLARLAASTGGAVLELDQAAELAELLQRRADLQVAAPERHPLVLSFWWVLLLGLSLGGEWWLRRKQWGAL